MDKAEYLATLDINKRLARMEWLLAELANASEALHFNKDMLQRMDDDLKGEESEIALRLAGAGKNDFERRNLIETAKHKDQEYMKKSEERERVATAYRQSIVAQDKLQNEWNYLMGWVRIRSAELRFLAGGN